MRTLVLIAFLVCSNALSSQVIILEADRVFDGENMQTNWIVLVDGNQIIGAGLESNFSIPKDAERIVLKGTTLMPGMIEGHSHLLLHPYDETGWNDQVLKESIPERVVRAVVHAEKTIMAGFTTVRDLGSEGAGYADVGLRQSIEKNIIPGPRMIVAGKAIVASGSYGPKGFAEHVEVPLGAEEADGHDDLIRVVRDQIGKGADVIKVYADYRWGPDRQAMPTFSIEELKLIVETAASSGRPTVAHAATAEGMRRASLAGVQTIEHGDGGTAEVFLLMKMEGVALCPTLAAGDAIVQYRGWKKGSEPDPERIRNKKESFRLALEAGVTIAAGGDVGVFSHGDNVRELEMMVEYGMKTPDVLQCITSGNADIFGMDHKLGRIKTGLLADLIAVNGNPLEDISALRQVEFVMKDGRVYKQQTVSSPAKK